MDNCSRTVTQIRGWLWEYSVKKGYMTLEKEVRSQLLKKTVNIPDIAKLLCTDLGNYVLSVPKPNRYKALPLTRLLIELLNFLWQTFPDLVNNIGILLYFNAITKLKLIMLHNQLLTNLDVESFQENVKNQFPLIDDDIWRQIKKKYHLKICEGAYDDLQHSRDPLIRFLVKELIKGRDEQNLMEINAALSSRAARVQQYNRLSLNWHCTRVVTMTTVRPVESSAQELVKGKILAPTVRGHKIEPMTRLPKYFMEERQNLNFGAFNMLIEEKPMNFEEPPREDPADYVQKGQNFEKEMDTEEVDFCANNESDVKEKLQELLKKICTDLQKKGEQIPKIPNFGKRNLEDVEKYFKTSATLVANLRKRWRRDSHPQSKSWKDLEEIVDLTKNDDKASRDILPQTGKESKAMNSSSDKLSSKQTFKLAKQAEDESNQTSTVLSSKKLMELPPSKKEKPIMSFKSSPSPGTCDDGTDSPVKKNLQMVLEDMAKTVNRLYIPKAMEDKKSSEKLSSCCQSISNGKNESRAVKEKQVPQHLENPCIAAAEEISSEKMKLTERPTRDMEPRKNQIVQYWKVHLPQKKIESIQQNKKSDNRELVADKVPKRARNDLVLNMGPLKRKKFNKTEASEVEIRYKIKHCFVRLGYRKMTVENEIFHVYN